TIFIAFVICCVFLTARMRRRRSIREGIIGFLAGPQPRSLTPRTRRAGALACWRGRRRSRGGRLPRREVGGEVADRCVERALQLIVELLLFGDAAEHLRRPAFDESIQVVLER